MRIFATQPCMQCNLRWREVNCLDVSPNRSFSLTKYWKKQEEASRYLPLKTSGSQLKRKDYRSLSRRTNRSNWSITWTCQLPTRPTAVSCNSTKKSDWLDWLSQSQIALTSSLWSTIRTWSPNWSSRLKRSSTSMRTFLSTLRTLHWLKWPNRRPS